jgi:hypothetical protein
MAATRIPTRNGGAEPRAAISADAHISRKQRGPVAIAWAAIALAGIPLSGCSSAAQDAEEQFNIIDQSALSTDADRCQAAGKVAEAYLAAKDTDQFERWRVTQQTYCLSARLAP